MLSATIVSAVAVSIVLIWSASAAPSPARPVRAGHCAGSHSRERIDRSFHVVMALSLENDFGLESFEAALAILPLALAFAVAARQSANLTHPAGVPRLAMTAPAYGAIGQPRSLGGLGSVVRRGAAGSVAADAALAVT